MWFAINSIGIHAESGLLTLNSYENRVYQFTDEKNHRYVVKFYRPNRWTKEQIIEEHQFSIELMEHDIPVAPPLLINGETLHYYKGYFFALFDSAGGRQFEVDNFNQLEWVGRFLGRIHKVGSIKQFQHRPTIGLDEYVHQPKILLENSNFIPSYLENTFFNDLDLLITAITNHWDTQFANIRLHGDCHPSNILWRDGPIFVDLDDARNGYQVQDLWMMLNGDRQDKLVQIDILLEGYSTFHEFNSAQLKLIEPLRCLRMIHYMSWLAKRWNDPAFPIAFPWFGELKYWENQVLMFKEQLAALEELPLCLNPM